MKYKKLSQYAKDNGLNYFTTYNHFKKGIIPNTKVLDTGTILVGIEESIPINNNKVAIYARVSSNDMKNNLLSQEKRLHNYAINNGYQIIHSIKEISSGMNDKRVTINILKYLYMFN